MKPLLPITTLAFCMTAAFGSALADDNQKSASDRTTSQNMHRSDTKIAPDLNRASTLIGADVVDAKGDKIGDIKDIVLDRARGQVAYAVVSFGGTLGVGAKYFAIPWKSLQAKADDKFMLNVDREKLKDAPGFDKDHWPDMASQKWNTDTARYYHQRPYWEGGMASRRSQQSSGSSGKVERGESSSGSAGDK